MQRRTAALVLAPALVLTVAMASAEERPRARDLGIRPGVLPTGSLNAITDVTGVRVGHTTLIEGETVRTGVTAILPHDGNLFQHKAPAGVYAANAFGKAAGLLQVRELGTLETPIVLTNTLCVGTAVQAVVDWTLAQPGNEAVRSVNAVVGETNDGYLNDIRHCAVGNEHVVHAIAGARPGPVAEGTVGAGTGTSCFGFKGGIGTASRRLPEGLGGYTVGALVQSNYDGILSVDGLHVGQALGRYAFKEQLAGSAPPPTDGPGSCMVVLATDAPVDARNLERMARRAVLGLARTGSFMANGSGDFVIAFSTRNLVAYEPDEPVAGREVLSNGAVSPLFLATVEAVEEAVYNSLLRATTVTGFEGHTRQALPLEPLRELVAARRDGAHRP